MSKTTSPNAADPAHLARAGELLLIPPPSSERAAVAPRPAVVSAGRWNACGRSRPVSPVGERVLHCTGSTSYALSGATAPFRCRAAAELTRLGGSAAQPSATRMIVLP